MPDPALDEQYAGVLEGTIIANRTEANVRFFVEGQVYDLAPLRCDWVAASPRATAVLNLFNCDAIQSAEGDAGCFWDPYLLKQDGFYELVTGAEAGLLVSLSLREAGAAGQPDLGAKPHRRAPVDHRQQRDGGDCASQRAAVQL